MARWEQKPLTGRLEWMLEYHMPFVVMLKKKKKKKDTISEICCCSHFPLSSQSFLFFLSPFPLLEEINSSPLPFLPPPLFFFLAEADQLPLAIPLCFVSKGQGLCSLSSLPCSPTPGAMLASAASSPGERPNVS